MARLRAELAQERARVATLELQGSEAPAAAAGARAEETEVYLMSFGLLRKFKEELAKEAGQVGSRYADAFVNRYITHTNSEDFRKWLADFYMAMGDEMDVHNIGLSV